MNVSFGYVCIPVVASILTLAAGGSAAEGARHCARVHGTITTTITTEGCPSEIGLCTVGTIHGGPLHGATTFSALGAAPSAGMPNAEPASVLSYSGRLTITTRCGAITVRDVGVLDNDNLAFSEIDRVVAGTGEYAGASGVFFAVGEVIDDGAGFRGELSGEICTR
jgi:hypothetical protein